MTDLATLEHLKDQLDDWDAEATRLEAEAHRAQGNPALDAVRPTVSAWRLRACIEELGELFSEARDWHAKGVVPAAPDDLEPLARQLVEEWRSGKDSARCMHELWEALEPGVPNNDQPSSAPTVTP